MSGEATRLLEKKLAFPNKEVIYYPIGKLKYSVLCRGWAENKKTFCVVRELLRPSYFVLFIKIYFALLNRQPFSPLWGKAGFISKIVRDSETLEHACATLWHFHLNGYLTGTFPCLYRENTVYPSSYYRDLAVSRRGLEKDN